MDERSEWESDLLARSMVVTRLIDAPRELVFETWTDPKHFAQWWGPNGFTTTTHSFDFRPGGVWRFVMHGPDGRNYQNRIVFDVIVKPERIEYHHDSGDDLEPAGHRTIATFEDVGGKTHITLHAVFPTADDRRRIAREYGAVEGGHQTLGRLGEYVAQLKLARPKNQQ